MAKKKSEDLEYEDTEQEAQEVQTEVQAEPVPQPDQPQVPPPPPRGAPEPTLGSVAQIKGTPYFARRVASKFPAMRVATSRYAHREWIRNWKRQILMRGYR